MNSIKEWAEYYQSMHVWVYPYMSEEQPWKYWKSKNDSSYKDLSETWTWNNDTGLKLIVGKKGIRVLEVTIPSDNRDKIVLKVLKLLGIENNEYPWIIEKRDGIAIIVDTPSISPSVKGMGNRGFLNTLVLWEGYYVLPSTGVPIYFYKNRMPEKHPVQVPDDTFFKCVETIRKEVEPKVISFKEDVEQSETVNQETTGWVKRLLKRLGL